MIRRRVASGIRLRSTIGDLGGGGGFDGFPTTKASAG
jgi:hypothetical protein